MKDAGRETNKGLLEGVIEALVDRQSQVDLRLDDLTLSWPGTHISVQLSGTVTLSVHMRELTDKEKDAHAMATVAHLKS